MWASIRGKLGRARGGSKKAHAHAAKLAPRYCRSAAQLRRLFTPDLLQGAGGNKSPCYKTPPIVTREGHAPNAPYDGRVKLKLETLSNTSETVVCSKEHRRRNVIGEWRTAIPPCLAHFRVSQEISM